MNCTCGRAEALLEHPSLPLTAARTMAAHERAICPMHVCQVEHLDGSIRPAIAIAWPTIDPTPVCADCAKSLKAQGNTVQDMLLSV